MTEINRVHETITFAFDHDGINPGRKARVPASPEQKRLSLTEKP